MRLDCSLISVDGKRIAVKVPQLVFLFRPQPSFRLRIEQVRSRAEGKSNTEDKAEVKNPVNAQPWGFNSI